MEFDYSIVIRTLGNTGEKYLQMLNAINNQTVKPREIVVVIPKGYELDHSMGNERVVFSEKGMVTQRAVGIEEAKGEYMLVLDDDLDFPADFAKRLYLHLVNKKLDCVLVFGNGGRETLKDADTQRKVSFKKRAVQFFKRLRLAFTGQCFYSQRKSPFFDTITSTGGHRTYVNCEDGLCQTGAFACFFIKSDKAKAVKLNDERWLQEGRLSAYAAYDDAVFYYKLFKQGGRIAYTRNTDFEHLDAASGRPAPNPLSAKRNRLYLIARNRTVFWYRHIWSDCHKLHVLAGGIYGMVNYAIYYTIVNLYPKNWPAIGALYQGYRDAFSFIRKNDTT